MAEPLQPVQETPPTLREEFVDLLSEDFEFQLRTVPEFATQAGFHEYDSCLQDLGPQILDLRKDHNAEARRAMEGILARQAEEKGDLRPADLLYADLWLDALDGEVRGLELGCHLMPLNSIGVGGVHENFLEVIGWMPFKTEDHYKQYITRIMAFPEQVQQTCDLLAFGACQQGVCCSQSMMRRVPDRLRELIASDLPELKEPLEAAEREGKKLDPEIIRNTHKAIDKCFRPALKRLLDFIEEFYKDMVRADPACKAVKNGEKMYAECLRFHTSTAMTAQEIHDLGLKEVARIEARFQEEVLKKVGFEGSTADYAKTLKADKAYFWDSEEELVEGYKALVAKIQTELPKFFDRLPKMPLEVVPKKSGPAAYYFAGVPEDRPGRFYVNVARLETRAKYEMAVFALHEGVPGHHLQTAIALENEDLPSFLRYIEDRRYEFGPARRPLYAAYMEGWALYCEKLGEEMGMYGTPQELFGRLSLEMMRAVRLVVDTGIHAFGWSIEKASDYMLEKTGMASEECLEECHRYAAWPGQACSYKVGQLAIEDMRQKAEAALGAEFKLPAFHEVLLSAGPMPLDKLGERVAAWVAGQKA